MADQVTRSLTINAPIETVYQIWANFETFPHFMQNIERVTKTGDGLSHWVMRGPLGTQLSWDARTTRLDENERVAWNSLDGGDIKTSGQVIFHENSDGSTEIVVTLLYVPPFGKLGDAVAHLFDNPEQKLEEDLRNFQRYAESQHSGRSYEVGA